jgi:LPXTG-motif cell wall-anchored protein
VAGEVNKPRRRNTGAMIGFAVALGILLLGTGGVLWWRRPGRYIPA